TGELARVLAEVVGTAGQVVATDVAEGMVDLMRDRLAQLPQVEVRTCDAAATGLPASHVDAVLARMSLMFSPDPVAAVGEARRVLVPGGRYVAATWAGPMDNMWMASVGMAAAMNGAWQGSSPMDPGGPFSLSEAKQLVAVLEEAGLAEVEVVDVPIEVRFSDAEAHFAHVSSMAGPLAVALSAASDDMREAVRRTAADTVARFLTDDGLVFPGLARLAVGSRPA
ncbi:MAG TPA: class I SAM-dependent methyltransferase, partial [Mycobacteriales bacterium]|nr:class I SAM-dependent methyltransferase [Mycobacteriales bacterium]